MSYFSANTVNTLIIIGVIQGMIFSLAFFLSEQRHEKTLLFLILTVVTLSFNNLQYWFRDVVVMENTPYAHHFILPWMFLILPMFYQFFINYLRVKDHLPSISKLAISLFIIAASLRIALITYSSRYLDPTYGNDLMKQFNLWEEGISCVFNLSVFLFAIILLLKNQHWYDYIKGYDSLKWIQVFFILASTVILLWVAAFIMHYFPSAPQPPVSYYPVRLGNSFVIYYTGYQGLFKYRLLKERMLLRKQLSEKPAKTKESIPDKEQTARVKPWIKEVKIEPDDSSKGSIEKHDVILVKMDEIIIGKKEFLNPMVSLESIADQLNISTSYLSMIINKSKETSFNDYLNTLRVQQSQNLLLDNNYKHYTVAAIGLESGFNSKSAFYNSFKRITGKSPSEFRNKTATV